jgi:MFS family permease
MTDALALLRTDRRARLFFAALAQSALGTGAAYPALLVIAYERFHSAWAISLVLLADFVPSMVAGPLLGAVVDRWPRLWCAVAADLVRVGAFIGIAVVGSFEATVGLAVLAGLGTAVFKPAALAGIPDFVEPERVPPATSLYGALADFGLTGGPALAALAFLFVGAEELLIVNGITFAISAVVLARLALVVHEGRLSDEPDGAGVSLLRQARAGLSVSLRMPGIRVVVLAFAPGMFLGGIFNVVELPHATNALGTDVSGYSLLITVYGLGFVGGSLRGSTGGDPSRLKRRYVEGLLLTGAGSLAAGASPALALAVAAFAVGGYGNGLAIVHQRLLFQSQVPAPLHGRVFAIADALMAWGFALGFLAAGAIAAASSPRPILIAIGAGELVLALIVGLALRRQWSAPLDAQADLRRDADALRDSQVGEHRAHLVDGAGFWLAILDDLGERRDDVGVELRPGISD